MEKQTSLSENIKQVGVMPSDYISSLEKILSVS